GGRLEFGLLGVAIELPEQVALLRLEAVQPAVAAGEDHFLDAVDLGRGRVAPGAVHDVRPGQIAAPDDVAGLLVHRDEAGRVGVLRLLVVLVNAVRRDGVHEIVDDQRRSAGDAPLQAAGPDFEVLDHVQGPDDLALARRAGVAGRVGADQLAAVADVINPVAVHARRGDRAANGRIHGRIVPPARDR